MKSGKCLSISSQSCCAPCRRTRSAEWAAKAKSVSIVRLISASNRDIKRMIQEGQFREDLYYRIKVLEIEIPPLRERREDIPVLVAFFLERYARRALRVYP